MKFNKRNMMKATARTLGSSETWAKIYDKAPELAKERLRVAFWGSAHLDENEDLDRYRSYREELEARMSCEDFAYLAGNFPPHLVKAREHYERLRDEARLRPMKTAERLDAAIDEMTEGCSENDRKRYEKTRRAMRKCTDPLVRYESFWKAVGGSGDDCCLLGDVFNHGHGVERDADLALFWFRKGALCGNGEACGYLARMYADEKGPCHDPEKARFWFAEGARRNDPASREACGI